MIRQLIILLLIISPVVLNAQNRPNRTEFTKYPNSRQKKEEKIYKNNRVISWIQWYEDGQKKMQKSFKEDGRKHGKFAEWYSNGNLKNLTEYSNDSIIGTAYIWYESGKKEFENIYEDNRLVIQKKYATNGLMIYEENYQVDKTIRVEYQWFINKQVKEEKFYENGNIFKRTEYYPSGQKLREEDYVLGKIHGMVYEWHENGKVRTEKTYSNGTMMKMIKYNESGQIEGVNVYDKNLKP